MYKEIKNVEEFHKAFGLVVNTSPTLDSIATMTLREDLMDEELKEVKEALWKGSLEEITKEMADLLYVIFGTAVSLGLQEKLVQVFNIIHESNMSKLDENGKPIINGQNGVFDPSRPMGKALKPAHFKPADTSHLFQ